MRTPGRCTNHDHCWLGNARRDVWVAVDQAFLCPVCGTKLVAPPVQTMARKGMARSAAAGASVLVLAALTGFAFVRVTGVLLPHQAMRVTAATAVKAAPSRLSATLAISHPAAPQPTAVALATKPASPEAAPDLETTGESAARMLLKQVKLATPPTRAVPQPRLVLPVSFGRPAAPEDVGTAPAGAWHRHVPTTRRDTGFLPGPGEARLVIAAADDATQGSDYAPLVRDDLLVPAQGDSDEAAARFETGMPVPVSTPAHQASTDMVPRTASTDTVLHSASTDTVLHTASTDTVLRSAVVAANEVPRGLSRAEDDVAPDVAPSMAATPASLTVAALGASVVTHIFGGNPVPSLPPERVDPAQAAQADVASNPLVKLVTLPPAHPDTLPKPSYPPVYADEERPGQVQVGCTITTTGTPTGCQVLDEHGGARFADSVISWLQSGDVRYRPGIDAGRIVTAPRQYKVRFVPE